MAERIPQSTTIRVPLRAYLSTDHLSAATGKTIAVTISKNGAAFGNPSAGATNATEIASGWYYVDLSTTDTGTAGPLLILGTASGVDTVEVAYSVISTTAVQTGVNVVAWNGTTVATPATAGVPDVNAKNINNVATTSVTTINANQGTTQPVNFTGTGASALAKADMVDVAGAAVSTTSAQLGVNAVNWAGGAIPAPAVTGVPRVDLTYILGTILTETAGLIAAGFKKFFNVVTPTSTMNEITLVDTTTTLTNPPVITDPLLSTVPGSYVSGSAGYALGTTNTNVSTILSRLGTITGTGVNTVLGYFKALLSKVATTPSDIGGTFDSAADSTEAIADAIAAGGSGDTSSFSGAAATEIDAIKAMTDKISLPGIFFAPFFGSPDSSVKTIWRWRDYLLTNGQQIDYQIVGLDPADVVTWTIACAGQETTKTLTYVAADTPLARLQLTRTETGAFVRGEWPVEVYVTNALGDKAEKYYSTIRIKDVLKK